MTTARGGENRNRGEANRDERGGSEEERRGEGTEGGESSSTAAGLCHPTENHCLEDPEGRRGGNPGTGHGQVPSEVTPREM